MSAHTELEIIERILGIMGIPDEIVGYKDREIPPYVVCTECYERYEDQVANDVPVPVSLSEFYTERYECDFCGELLA